METITGIIVEYNPFHKGHLYHIKKAVETTACEAVVAVMSGDFVQRGEPAIIDKQTRTKMALSAGVNLVLEIPSVFAVQDANGFALGSVGVLERSGVISHIVFGSESGELASLERLAEHLHDPKIDFIRNQRKYMKLGLSFPNARKKALAETMYHEKQLTEEVLSLSNNILAVEYLKTLREYRSKITPVTIRREGAQYNDLFESTTFSSASAIRRWIENREDLRVSTAMPLKSWQLLQKELTEGRGPAFIETLSPFILSFLRSRNRDQLKRYSGVVEGLDARFIDASKNARSIKELLEEVKTKRFTYSKLRRMILYFLFEIEGSFIDRSNKLGPQYIKVLGFDAIGKAVLKKMRNRSRLPILSTSSTFIKLYKKLHNSELSERLDPNFDYSLFKQQLELNFRMTDFYRRTFFNNTGTIKMDIQTPPIQF
jgi:predicted nucleotidyltransferase